MRQLMCRGPQQLALSELAEPHLQNEHQALVRPLAVARCDIDLFICSGLFPIAQPFALGHECVAEIVALGAAVSGLAVGQRVVVSFQVSCGTCKLCQRGKSAVCERMPILSDYGMQPLSGVEYGGMLAELLLVPFAEAMLQPVARDIDPVAIASASDNVLDGYRAVAPHLAELPGAELLIVAHGASSIPLYAVQAALALGASRVDFASQDSALLAHAERLGARAIATDLGRHQLRYPIVVDAGISTKGLLYALESTESEGVCQSVSYYPAKDLPLPLGKLYTRGVRFFIGRTHAAALLPQVIPLIEAGRLRPGEVTTRVIDFADAPALYLEPSTKLIVRMPGG